MNQPPEPSATPLVSASPAEQSFNDWVQAERLHRAPAGLADAIQRRVMGVHVERETQDWLERVFGWLLGHLWRPVAVGAVPLLVGLAAGWFVPHEDDAVTLAQTLDQWSFADTAADASARARGDEVDDPLR